MTTPAPATTMSTTASAAPAKPDPAKTAAAAMWRSLCILAARVDPRLTAEWVADDPGSVANLAHLYGGDPADAAVIANYVTEEKLTP